MKRLCIIIALTGGSAFAMAEEKAPAGNPEQLFREGVKKYRAENYQEGVDALAAALDNIPKDNPPFDPALAHYNRGIGQFRLSKPEDAAKSFQEALRTSDLQLQHKAYFNLGNTQYQLAQNALNEGDVATGFQLFQAASTNFMQSLRIDANDRDAKVNYELCLQAQVRILQMVAMAMQHLQQGEQLVGQYKFIEAAQWFQQNFEAVDKALSLEPDVKKQFENMSQRTASVAEILAPPSPAEGTP